MNIIREQRAESLKHNAKPPIMTENPLIIPSSAERETTILNLPENLTSVKDEIMNCIKISHGCIYDVCNGIANNQEGTRKDVNMNLPMELTEAVLNGISNQIQEIFSSYFNDRSKTIHEEGRRAIIFRFQREIYTYCSN
jgi:hypothetical protein